MNPITVLVAMAAYFAVILAVSATAARRQKADSATFFNGGRRMPWLAVGIAMIGASISGVTFISVPGMVVAKGHTYLQMVLGFIVGYVVIAALLVPLFYRRNLLSIYGYLEERFGAEVRKTGAAFFFISKLLGAGVRFFVVCAVLQVMVFTPLGIPFVANVAITVALIWLYTFKAGVASLVWTDMIKSCCLVGSVVLAIWFIAHALGLDAGGVASMVANHPTAAMFNFDEPMSTTYFWKQFIAGVFMAIAMNGLDQDMMQRHLSCRDSLSSRKNMIFSGVMQFFVIALFLVLGTMLVAYCEHSGIALPEKTDELFGIVASHPSMPAMLGPIFIVGLVSAAYSAAGSAMTSLTTAFTIDLLDGEKRFASRLPSARRKIHAAMGVAIAMVIIAFYYLGTDDAISAVYTLASYTYGPLLGLFAYGLATTGMPPAKGVAAVCVASPFASWAISAALTHYHGYAMGFELLLLNALLTIAGITIAEKTVKPIKRTIANGQELV